MPTVTDNADENRFEMAVEGHVAFVVYRRAPPIIQLLHAEVPPALEGKGVGSALVRATLDALRLEGLKVVPRCPFISAFIRKNPVYEDMLA